MRLPRELLIVGALLAVLSACPGAAPLGDLGAPCTSGADCASGACQSHQNTVDCTSVCVQPVALDDECAHVCDDFSNCERNFRTECTDGLICALAFDNQVETSRVCVEPLALDAPCNPDIDACADGLACAPPCGQVSNTRCTPVADDGAVCIDREHTRCLPCRPGRECFDIGASGDVLCAEVGSFGDPCTPHGVVAGADDGCSAGFTCNPDTRQCE